jgi:hypothetical protein
MNKEPVIGVPDIHCSRQYTRFFRIRIALKKLINKRYFKLWDESEKLLIFVFDGQKHYALIHDRTRART